MDVKCIIGIFFFVLFSFSFFFFLFLFVLVLILLLLLLLLFFFLFPVLPSIFESRGRELYGRSIVGIIPQPVWTMRRAANDTSVAGHAMAHIGALLGRGCIEAKGASLVGCSRRRSKVARAGST
jgi:hypothetical protein